MRANWIRVSPKSNDRHLCHKRRQGRSCEDRSRDCSHEATAKGHPGPPEAGGGEERKDPPPPWSFRGGGWRSGDSLLLLNFWPPEL